jgi:hypothetical protein
VVFFFSSKPSRGLASHLTSLPASTMNKYLFSSSNPVINDENFNVLNVASGGKLQEKVLQLSSSSKANTSAPSLQAKRVVDSRPSSTDAKTRQHNATTDVSTKSGWDEANRSSGLTKVNSDDTEDEIMQFRASSFDSDGPIDDVSQSRLLGNFEQTIPVPPLNIKAIGMLPTIIEASSSEESTVYVAFNQDNPSLSFGESIDFDEMYVRGRYNEESVEMMAVTIPVQGGYKVGVLLMHRVQVVKRGHLQ